MVLLVIIAVAAWSYTRYVVDSHTNSLKADDTSKDYCGTPTPDIIPLNPVMKDRISELPDDILSQILMPLSLRDVVRLTILSRRWRSIWFALSHLDFDWLVMHVNPKPVTKEARCDLSLRDVVRLTILLCRRWRSIWFALSHLDFDWLVMHVNPKPVTKEARCDLYVKSVNQVLQRWRNNMNILSFRISCCLDREYASDVRQWLNFSADLKNLESLTLQFEHEKRSFLMSLSSYEDLQVNVVHSISCSFLSRFSRLEKLHLEACSLNLQSDFRFNRLKSLSLSHVMLEGIQWESLLICCPTIESLQLRCCNLPHKLCIGYKLQHLSLLRICECPTLRTIELNASNLKTFSLDECVSCVLDCATLENIFISTGEANDAALHMLKGMVKDLSGPVNVVLRVQIHKFKLHSWPSDLFRSVLWLHLDLILDYCCPVDTTKSLTHLPRCFPMLRKLDLTIPIFEWPYTHEPPTLYIHTSLKEVGLYDFRSSWTKFASFLLRSSAVLEKMVITGSCRNYYGWGNWAYYSRSVSEWERSHIQSTLHGKAISAQANIIVQ